MGQVTVRYWGPGLSPLPSCPEPCQHCTPTVWLPSNLLQPRLSGGEFRLFVLFIAIPAWSPAPHLAPRPVPKGHEINAPKPNTCLDPDDF